MRLTFFEMLELRLSHESSGHIPGSVNCWYSGIKRQEQSGHVGSSKLKNVRNKYKLYKF